MGMIELGHSGPGSNEVVVELLGGVTGQNLPGTVGPTLNLPHI